MNMNMVVVCVLQRECMPFSVRTLLHSIGLPQNMQAGNRMLDALSICLCIYEGECANYVTTGCPCVSVTINLDSKAFGRAACIVQSEAKRCLASMARFVISFERTCGHLTKHDSVAPTHNTHNTSYRTNHHQLAPVGNADTRLWKLAAVKNELITNHNRRHAALIMLIANQSSLRGSTQIAYSHSECRMRLPPITFSTSDRWCCVGDTLMGHLHWSLLWGHVSLLFCSRHRWIVTLEFCVRFKWIMCYMWHTYMHASDI